MKYIKILVLILAILFFAQCSVMKPASERKVTKELSEYKLMTEYILCKNYHLNFTKDKIYSFVNLPENDSLVYNFMRKNNIFLIYIQKGSGFTKLEEENFKLNNPGYRGDSLIEYHFIHIPVFGRRRELKFDFSSDKKIQSEKRKGSKQVVLEEGIYYVEY